MATFKVNKAQNLLDICLQVYGTTQQLFKLAKDNGLSIDSDINIGDSIIYDESLGNLGILNKIRRDSLDMVNPVEGQSASVDTVEDGLGNAFTDGLGNIFTFN